jgi:hypothetical protein
MTESKITHHLKANDYWLGAPEAKPARPRQRKVTLASELRKASKAGVGVRRAEIEPDREGRPHHYFRRASYPRVRLPGLPWSPTFMNAYEKALTGPRAAIGAGRIKPGSVTAVVAEYFDSQQFFASKSAGTQRMRRGILERFRAAHGDKGIATLARTHVERMVAARADAPASAHNFLAVLRALMRYAVTTGLRSDDPTIGVRAPRYKPKGYPTWTEEDIASFEARHAKGTKARLALALLLYTAPR